MDTSFTGVITMHALKRVCSEADCFLLWYTNVSITVMRKYHLVIYLVDDNQKIFVSLYLSVFPGVRMCGELGNHFENCFYIFKTILNCKSIANAVTTVTCTKFYVGQYLRELIAGDAGIIQSAVLHYTQSYGHT